jgi:hypothetical protein
MADAADQRDHVRPDHIIQGRLPYRHVGAKTDDPMTRNKPRVIIPHNGKSFAAPPL